MKALSIKQPWADLRMQGKYLLEVRRYSTNHRGKILIHASNNVDRKLCDKLKVEPCVRGALLGYVDLKSIEEKVSAQRWKETKDKHLLEGHRLFGANTNFWHLQNPKAFSEPITYKGTQGLFDVPGSIIPRKKIVLPTISPDLFKEILPIICEKDSSFDPNGWSKDNPLWGHCAVVSLLAQRLFGGQILKAPLGDFPDFASLRSHYWNMTPDGTEIDFTKEQFGKNCPKDLKGKPRTKSKLLSSESTLKRYKKLEGRFVKLFRFVEQECKGKK